MNRQASRPVDAEKRYTEWFNPTDPSAESSVAALGKRSFTLRRERVKLSDVAWMADKLATTQAAGLPTYRALGMLGRMKSGTALGAVLLDIQKQMGDGRSLSEGFRSHERSFGPLVCALIEAGEASGSLERALAKIAELTESAVRLRRKVRGAMMYPISVIVITTVLIAALLLFVVPKFADIYNQAGGQLPPLTIAIVTASKYAPYLAVGFTGLAIMFMGLLQRAKHDVALRRRLDRIKLRVPLTGSLVRKGADARVAATMANLLAAGVPLLEAIVHAQSVAGNLIYRDALAEVRKSVSDGSTFTSALERAGTFPDMMVQLASVGEESGALPALMERYAKSAEEEVANTAEALTTMIEPLMMVVIGAIVGVFLLGLYMPIIEIGNQIK